MNGGKLLVLNVTSRLCSAMHSQLSGIHFPYRFNCYQRLTCLCSKNCLKLSENRAQVMGNVPSNFSKPLKKLSGNGGWVMGNVHHGWNRSTSKLVS